MPLYLCAWQNGTRSVVWAEDEDDAVERLDEWGNAEECELVELEEFLVDFARITEEADGGPDLELVELVKMINIGEETERTILAAEHRQIVPEQATSDVARVLAETMDLPMSRANRLARENPNSDLARSIAARKAGP